MSKEQPLQEGKPTTMDAKAKEEKRKALKEATYTKYTDVIKVLKERQYYDDFEGTLTTFLALTMIGEVSKRNLMKMGADPQQIEEARKTSMMEIWALLEMHDQGKIISSPSTKAKDKK